MSMICWLLAVSPAQIAALKATPALAGDVASVAANDGRDAEMAAVMAKAPEEARRRHEESQRALREQYPESEARLAAARTRIAPLGPFAKPLCLEKAWHMLHYLMTGHGWDLPDVAAAPGDALLTGEPLGANLGYGPARLHAPDATQAFARFLATQDVAVLQGRVNLSTMANEDIYGMPMGPGPEAEYEAELRMEVAHFFPLLRAYVAAAAGRGDGLLVWLN